MRSFKFVMLNVKLLHWKSTVEGCWPQTYFAPKKKNPDLVIYVFFPHPSNTVMTFKLKFKLLCLKRWKTEYLHVFLCTVGTVYKVFWQLIYQGYLCQCTYFKNKTRGVSDFWHPMMTLSQLWWFLQQMHFGSTKVNREQEHYKHHVPLIVAITWTDGMHLHCIHFQSMVFYSCQAGE